MGHHMFRHKESPFNEKVASFIQSSTTRIAYEIANPTHPIDPLFESPIHKKEVMDEMQRLTHDKSPGPDGVTNRMLRSGGEMFNTILHEVIATLWDHQAQPSEWHKSLMHPIYKGGRKPKPDPASYRGIYLSSALAKLFEGIIIKQLTQYTEQHSTLTDNQLGTMKMIAFITIKSNSVPLIEGLCAQIYLRFEISVVLLTSSSFLFVKGKTCYKKTKRQLVQTSTCNPSYKYTCVLRTPHGICVYYHYSTSGFLPGSPGVSS